MLRFIVRRLLLLVPILLGLSILVFVWIRALPGSPAESLLGEHATPQAVAQIRHQYGLDKPIYVQYWDYLKTIGSGNLGTSIATHAHGDLRVRASVSGDRRAGAQRHAVRARARRAARSAVGQEVRVLVRPRQPRRVADRDLDPDLLPRADPQVHLRRQAALAPEHRPRERARGPAAPDELLPPRRDHRA